MQQIFKYRRLDFAPRRERDRNRENRILDLVQDHNEDLKDYSEDNKEVSSRNKGKQRNTFLL
jgi:hypothetical protein